MSYPLAKTAPVKVLRGAARGIHALTTIHGAGSMVCLFLATATGLSPGFRDALAISPGAKLMIGLFGSLTFLFLAGIATMLAFLAFGSYRRRPWAWPLTIAAYSIGVIGSLWEVSIGIQQAWVAAAINALVVSYATLPSVREAYVGVPIPPDDHFTVH